MLPYLSSPIKVPSLRQSSALKFRINVRIFQSFMENNILFLIVLFSSLPVKMIKSSSDSSILLYNWKNSHHIFNTKPFQRHGDFFKIPSKYIIPNVNLFQCFVSVTFTQSPLSSFSVIPNNFCKYLAKLS